MANTKQWPDPDTQFNEQGREDVFGVYLLSPSTQKAAEPGGGAGGSITNDGTFAKETGGNLAAAKTDLDTIVTNTTGVATAANQATANTSLGSVVTNTSTTATNTSTITTATGAKGDPLATDSTSSWSVIALLKGLYAKLAGTLSVSVTNGNTNGQATMANSSPVVLASDEIVPIALSGSPGNEQWYTVDNAGDNAHHGIGVVAPYAYNGYPNYAFDKVRIANVYKTATATALGDTTLWTPTTGTKFRLMAYAIYVTQNAATSGGAMIEILLRDAATSLNLGFSVYCPSAAGTTFGSGASSGWVDLGNGKLSAAANNTLRINLSAALTAGEVRVVAIGMEE